MTHYDHKSTELKWQKHWAEKAIFTAHDFSQKPKFYCLDMFPYPSGAGLHVGHPLGYTATDIVCRHKRHKGFEVLHPMGWDAFGLPAENYAIKTGTHPEETTQKNIQTFKRQIQSLGLSYDWSREINTTDPAYYKWTQWLFLQMYKKGLLYEKKMDMAWCPQCKIVVANEEVEQGTHERCGNPVTRKSLTQWMFRITDYAERLLQDLDPPSIFLLHGWGGNGDNHWFSDIKEKAKSFGAKVYAPDFPNTETPKYEEWKTHFETHYGDTITVNSIFIGHSLGCQFALRYITEKEIEIDQLLLTAPPLTDCGIREISDFYTTSIDIEKLKKLTRRRFVFGSDNDHFIPEADFQVLAKNIDAEWIPIPQGGHLNEYFEPELEQKIQDIEKSVLDWTDKVHSMQKHWIGKSEGAEVDFKINGEKVTVFTTRPDTLFGATYFVLAPEHPLVDKITIPEQKQAVEEYKKVCASKSDLERTELNKEKTGVSTGAFAINPVNGEKIPVWISDYVMIGYGTGAVMAVPAHDERDFLFSQKFGLPIRPVVAEKVRTTQEEGPREVVCAVIENNAGEYLILNKKFKEGRATLCTGGVHQGESQEEAVMREIEEETGYKNFTIQECLGLIEENIPEKENRKRRRRWVTGYRVLLINEEKGSQREKDKKEFECEWVSKKEALMRVKKESPKPGEYLFLKRIQDKSICFTDTGIVYNSGFLNGLSTDQAQQKIIAWLEKNGVGQKKQNYKLRDWIFTRQRYWGEPIPLVHCDTCHTVPVPEEDLPIKLPVVEKYEPSDTGESPLANQEEWVNVSCPSCGGAAKRETSTMPNWAGSSWYWLRYMDPRNEQEFCSKNKEAYWGPVDLYVGGTEHAVLHLLYARFWQKVLYDLGLVSTKEPFKKLINQGLIIGEDGNKMSKSLGNVVNPDIIVEKYGADTLRMYEMFMGPFDQSKPWNSDAVSGMRKFIDRIWRLMEKERSDTPISLSTQKVLHKTIANVGEQIESFRFNTAISQLMICVNEYTKEPILQTSALEAFAILLSPFAPHLAEEIWSQLGHEKSIVFEPWPTYDSALLEDDQVTYAVQINGKVRADFEIEKTAEKETVLEKARSLEKIQKYIEGHTIQKEIFVPGKIVGFVLKPQ